jgi:hypothetical protein
MNKVLKMFLYSFFKSFLILFVIIGVGTVSYTFVIKFWGIETPKIAEIEETDEVKPITVPTIDDISKNLIFCYDDETKEIKKILLEVFWCADHRITYLTIPMRTQFTISNSLYQKLIVTDPSIPQIMKLSSISKYFDQETIYDYGVLITEDMLKADISYYTAVPLSMYQSIFESSAEEDEDQELTVEVFSDAFEDYLKKIKTEEDLKHYLTKSYPSVISNLTLNQKMDYLESYCRTSLSNVTFQLIGGRNKNSGYEIDDTAVRKQME